MNAAPRFGEAAAAAFGPACFEGETAIVVLAVVALAPTCFCALAAFEPAGFNGDTAMDPWAAPVNALLVDTARALPEASATAALPSEDAPTSVPALVNLDFESPAFFVVVVMVHSPSLVHLISVDAVLHP
jgi:hypothetical protein